MAEFSLQALHDEIEADPEGLGYKINGAWKGDQVIAEGQGFDLQRNLSIFRARCGQWI